MYFVVSFAGACSTVVGDTHCSNDYYTPISNYLMMVCTFSVDDFCVAQCNAGLYCLVIPFPCQLLNDAYLFNGEV